LLAAQTVFIARTASRYGRDIILDTELGISFSMKNFCQVHNLRFCHSESRRAWGSWQSVVRKISPSW